MFDKRRDRNETNADYDAAQFDEIFNRKRIPRDVHRVFRRYCETIRAEQINYISRCDVEKYVFHVEKNRKIERRPQIVILK
jgi:uncharacterized protein (DUF1015 family)